MITLAQIAVLLTATVVAIPLFRRFRLSAVLGYLAAGFVIGPWGLAVVPDPAAVGHIAEYGVVLLLFVIGLELQPTRLRAMRRLVFGLGSLQMLASTALLTLITRSVGLPWSSALVVAFALSLSSTPLVLQLLAERHELNTHHGRAGFAVLLFQDIAVMPMLAVLPLLAATNTTQSMTDSMLSMARALGVLLALVFIGRHLLRPLLRMVAATHVREAFTAAALLVVIGTSLLVNSVGLSMALGAFVAGLLLADSEYRHELEADIEPFKGLLLGLFFISVGMSAKLSILVTQPLTLLGLVLGLMVVKCGVLWCVARVMGLSGASARGFAMALPQAGEFGFVLFSMAVGHQLLTEQQADLLVLVVTVSMIISAPLMSLQQWIEPHLAADKPVVYDQIEPENSQVIIAGGGRFSQVISRVLRTRKIRFTLLEANPEQIETLRRFGAKVYFGDAARPELLHAAGTADATLFVLAVDDVAASVRIAELVRRHYPQVKLLVRARNRQHALQLMELGAHYVIRETFVSSLEMAQHALESLGISRTDAEASITRFRELDERTLREQLEYKDDEQKLIQSSHLVARELDRLFAADDQPAGTDAR